MGTAVIIQARLASTRFPRKAFADLCGKPVIRHVLESCHCAWPTVVCAIPDNEGELSEYLRKNGEQVFEGNPLDVLDRYYQAAKRLEIKHIIRVTADCPLVNPETIEYIANWCINGEYDFGSNDIDREWMCDGLDVEYMTFDLLEWLWSHATGDDREHVTSWVYKLISSKGNLGVYPSRNIRYMSFRTPINLNKIKLSIDTPEDLERVKNVIEGKKTAVLE